MLLDHAKAPSNEYNSVEMGEDFFIVNKRKSDNNHENRPYPTSELFNPPASSAPIIVSLVSEPESFNRLSLTEKAKFINELLQIIGPVNKVGNQKRYVYLPCILKTKDPPPQTTVSQRILNFMYLGHIRKKSPGSHPKCTCK